MDYSTLFSPVCTYRLGSFVHYGPSLPFWRMGAAPHTGRYCRQCSVFFGNRNCKIRGRSNEPTAGNYLLDAWRSVERRLAANPLHSAGVYHWNHPFTGIPLAAEFTVDGRPNCLFTRAGTLPRAAATAGYRHGGDRRNYLHQRYRQLGRPDSTAHRPPSVQFRRPLRLARLYDHWCYLRSDL